MRSFPAHAFVLASLVTLTLGSSAPLPSSPHKRQAVPPSSSPSSSTSINLTPELPRIPNIFIPVIAHTDPVRRVPPTTTATAATPSAASAADALTSSSPTPLLSEPSGESTAPNDNNKNNTMTDGEPTPSNEQWIEQCLAERSPTLPATFEVEVGIIRLFSLPSFKNEIGVERGCGCVELQSPLVIQSFVGSRNHSFTFYTKSGCNGQPHYQRFRQHFDLDSTVPTRSIRIVQGVLPPLPSG